MFNWLYDLFHWLMYSIYSWWFMFLGSIFENTINFIIDVMNAILSIPFLAHVFNTIQDFSFLILTGTFVALISMNLLSLESEKIKVIIKNTLTALMLITFISYPITALMEVTSATIDSDFLQCPTEEVCQGSSPSESFAISLANAFIWEVDEEGNRVEGNVIESVDDIAMDKEGKDINDRVGDRYKYDYMNFIFSFLILLVLFVLILWGIVKIFLKILQIIWLYFVAPLVMVTGIWSGTTPVKKYFNEFVKSMLAIALQIFTWAFFGWLMTEYVAMTSDYGFIIMITGILAIAVFMIDGPDVVVALFGFDLGVSSPTSIIAFRSATQMMSKGGSIVGSGVSKGGKALQLDHVGAGVKSGFGGSKFNDKKTSMEGKMKDTGEDIGTFFGGGKGNTKNDEEKEKIDLEEKNKSSAKKEPIRTNNDTSIEKDIDLEKEVTSNEKSKKEDKESQKKGLEDE